MNDGIITDLDFDDDIALSEDSWQGMAEITTRVEREAATVGLRINAGKTKLMVVGNMSDKKCIMAEGHSGTVDEFCYLGSVISDNSSCDKDETWNSQFSVWKIERHLEKQRFELQYQDSTL